MDFVSWIFFGPAKLIAAWQYAGALVAIILIGVQCWLSWRRRTLFEREFFREAPVFAGLLWLIFNLYEMQFAATSAPDGSSLRMDLIVLVPILYVLTLAAILSIRVQLQNRHTDG